MDTVVVGGCALELQRMAGEPERPTIVFLHEGLGSVSTWKGFPRALVEATGCPGLVFSRAGYGGSSPVPLPRPLTYMHHEGREVLPALLEATGVEDAILFGHSDGASIALLYASTAHGRGRVRGLVLEAPHVFCEGRSVAAIEMARERYENDDLRERLSKHHADVDVAFFGWNGAWLDPGFMEWNIEAELPAVRAPALVIQSDDDPYGTLRQLDAIDAGSGGEVARLVLGECGHAPHRDHPEVVIDASARFIGRVVHAEMTSG